MTTTTTAATSAIIRVSRLTSRTTRRCRAPHQSTLEKSTKSPPFFVTSYHRIPVFVVAHDVICWRHCAFWFSCTRHRQVAWWLAWWFTWWLTWWLACLVACLLGWWLACTGVCLCVCVCVCRFETTKHCCDSFFSPLLVRRWLAGRARRKRKSMAVAVVCGGLAARASTAAGTRTGTC